MQRTSSVPGRASAGTVSDHPPSKSTVFSRSSQGRVGTFWDMLGIRIIFTFVCAAAGFHFRPFGLSKELAALPGFLSAIAVLLFEVRLGKGRLRRFLCGA